jgi:hypothetical protein
MPTPTQIVLGALALVALGALFLAGRRLVSAWLTYRGTRIVVCPETRQAAAVEVDARQAALGASRSRPRLRLESCTRWPERQACGQECLAQVESAPETCLLLYILSEWYRGKTCAFCGRAFDAWRRYDHEPALLAPGGALVDWSDFPPAEVRDVLASHRPVCWNCRVAEGFRRQHPELVTDRSAPLGPPPSMA